MTISQGNIAVEYEEIGNDDSATKRSFCRRRCIRSSGFSVLLCRSSLSIVIVLCIYLANFSDAFGVSPARALYSRQCTEASPLILSAEGTPETELREASSTSTKEVTYRIRDCQYRELTNVAALVVESFYDKKKINLVARKLYQLAEMNRLQQNFPYPESREVHRMLVIEASPQGGEDEPTIVGFCDVDARPCATKVKLPRPYLSDLAVDPNHRRKGLAKMLVEASEEFVQSDNESDGAPFDKLWIRVASDNEAALGLYRDKLGYSFAEWDTGQETTGDEPEIFTLRKDFSKEDI